ncbi:CobW/HypB/UreG, nucleotide-binding domain-domain-containing protein [Catenaria anguillulae PL171]|uniref:CobW/HypB/UreG, nucleotide-binding domain-domain-containing protein n=1 Tax=Catenaria anguillulae PL171 TaxID=765915 RepID=A0A1Y2HAT3_9FUNG|nr:CobW/HypB/UreG, nucleotide-binding domain-domain-containing protein [Catenaria anguillulae PL171]
MCLGTRIIFDLIKRLQRTVPDYKVALLKNEFGDVKVDSLLADESSIQVTEMLNGCLCCVLVGQMQNALEEIRATYNPDRIIIESSGSAFPAPIAWQIRQIEPAFHLDSIITVIDVVNFRGYEDTSYTAKMQAQYTDLILLNKHELATERDLDIVLEHVYELNEDTPKVKYSHDLDLDLLFGLDTQLFASSEDGKRLGELEMAHGGEAHMENEVDLLTIESECGSEPAGGLKTLEEWEKFLGSLCKESIYRVKGLLRCREGESSKLWIVNHAFGRTSLTPVTVEKVLASHQTCKAKLTVMGVSMGIYEPMFRRFVGEAAAIHMHLAHRH